MKGRTQSITAAYSAIERAFTASGRCVHLSRGRGLFLRAREVASYHEFRWTLYPITAQQGPFVPRLHINQEWSRRSLPRSTEKRWEVDPKLDSLFRGLNFEITVLETEISALAANLPAIISHIEAGNRSQFECLLQFPTVSITPTNIWSQCAKTYEATARSNLSLIGK